jgi:hypothetical protein
MTHNHHQTRYSFYRSLDATALLAKGQIEQQAPRQSFSIANIATLTRQPQNLSEEDKLTTAHDRWREQLLAETWVIYTDESKSADGHNGAGWHTQRTGDYVWVMEWSGCCYLGQHLEVINDEAHTIWEAMTIAAKRSPSPPLYHHMH